MNVLFMVSFPLLLVRLPIHNFVNRQKTRVDENFSPLMCRDLPLARQARSTNVKNARPMSQSFEYRSE